MEQTSRWIFGVGTMVLVAALMWLPSSAVAADDLASELPQTGDTVVVVDFTKLRDSPLYDRGFSMFEAHPMGTEFVETLQNDLDVDPRTDIDALVTTSDSPPLNTDLLSEDNPSDAVEAATTGHTGGALMLVRGQFDAAEVLGAAAERFDADKQATDQRVTVKMDGIELRLIDEKTVAVATGSESHLAEVRRQFDDKPAGLTSVFSRAIEQLGSSKGLYLMIEPTIENPQQMRATAGAAASFAGIAIDAADTVRIGTLMTLENEQQVRQTVSDLDELSKQVADNPMANLLGFQPLLENLSIQQQGRDVLLRSSMTNQQASRLVEQIVSVIETEQQLQEPLEGDGFDPDPHGNDSSEDKDTSDNGVDADFN